jgi:hypothetical protein
MVWLAAMSQSALVASVFPTVSAAGCRIPKKLVPAAVSKKMEVSRGWPEVLAATLMLTVAPAETGVEATVAHGVPEEGVTVPWEALTVVTTVVAEAEGSTMDEGERVTAEPTEPAAESTT